MNDGKRGLEVLIGEKLSAVVFVLNYYQFQFDGPMFNVLTPVTVVHGINRARTGEDSFCNLLLKQISKIVKDVNIIKGDGILIEFEDGASIHFSLKDEDYPGPEAIIFQRDDGPWSVF